MNSKEVLINVIPAQAGIHASLVFLDSRLRGSDENRINQNFLNNSRQCVPYGSGCSLQPRSCCGGIPPHKNYWSNPGSIKP
jgi:hypothetical protein